MLGDRSEYPYRVEINVAVPCPSLLFGLLRATGYVVQNRFRQTGDFCQLTAAAQAYRARQHLLYE